MIVEYLGVNYDCPDWAQYVAADDNGEVRAFEFEPQPIKMGTNHYICNRGRQHLVGKLIQLPHPVRKI